MEVEKLIERYRALRAEMNRSLNEPWRSPNLIEEMEGFLNGLQNLEAEAWELGEKAYARYIREMA